ncbi:MAG: hypothetical protein ACOYN4_09850 [Bacteroidales bacterium]
MKKTFRYNVFYSVFVNGIEYPKQLPLKANSPEHAEEQLRKMMKSFPESEYMITKTEPA